MTPSDKKNFFPFGFFLLSCSLLIVGVVLILVTRFANVGSNNIDSATLSDIQTKISSINSNILPIQTLVGPQPWMSQHGCKVDNTGKRLYLGHDWDLKLTYFDLDTKESHIYSPAPDGQSDDIAIGPNNEVAWTQLIGDGVETGGWVYIRKSDGEKPYRANPTKRLPLVNSISWDRVNNYIYATQCFSADDAIWRIDPNNPSADPVRMTAPGALAGVFDGNDYLPSENAVYSGVWFAHNIAKLQMSGTPGTITSQVVYKGTTDQVFSGVAFDRDNYLWAVDTKSGYLHKFDKATNFSTIIQSFKVPPDADNFCIDKVNGNGNVAYVSNYETSSIYKVDPSAQNGSKVSLWYGSDYYANPKLAIPMGLSFDKKTQKIYIADGFGIKSIDKFGNSVVIKGQEGDALNFPTNCQITDQYFLLTAQFGVNALVVKRSDLSVVANIGHGTFGLPGDIRLLNSGALLVVDWSQGKLWHCTGATWSTLTAVVSGLQGPFQFAEKESDPNYIYVVESTAGRVTKVNLNTWEKSIVVTGLNDPQGIAFAPNGQLIVLENGSKHLSMIDLNTLGKTIIASNIPVKGVYASGWQPNYSFIVVDPLEGFVYFPSSSDAGLYYVDASSLIL